jgi:hypothetical protein
MDELLAYLGFLDGAAPLFGSGTEIPKDSLSLALLAPMDSRIFTISLNIADGR